MRARLTLIAAAVASMAALSAPAQAVTLDFSDLTSGACNFVGSPVVSQGFRFTDVSNGGLFLCNGGVIHNGPAPALIAANTLSVLRFERDDGALFSLQSFFAGSRTDGGSQATGINVVGTTGSGPVNQSFSFTGLDFAGFSLSPAFTGLTSVQITAVGTVTSPEFLINAIVVDSAAGGVPEPASWAMMIIGFGLVGATLRRRQSVIGHGIG